ncbi:MAG: NADH-quinone oxidoreductase subunit NuoH [Blastocatellia bacterium]|nr:NADH-quinone oxidoreductase subunit NuoH [Blastocatellia bacterium]
MEALLQSIDFRYLIETLIKIAIVFVIGLLSPVSMNWIERRALALMQNRLGPNRVGPFGLLQSVADGIKFLFKEDIIPLSVNKWLYILAPVVAVVPAFMVGIVYPFGPAQVNLPFIGPTDLFVTHFNIGLLYVLAMTSLGVYGIVLGGWASNSKYSLLGGLRSSAQMISYELALSLSLIAIVMQAGTLDLTKIVEGQGGWGGFKWNIFRLWPAGIFAFIIYLISAIAETNRIPFDLPEAETELVAGFHTEYSSSLKFAMFFMAEYVNMLTVSILATVLFLGGWKGPFVDSYPLLGPLWLLIKVFFFMFLYIWLRGTLPRFRYDQLMNFGWKFLLPAAVLNIILATVIGIFLYAN